jgi:hypothetical protein
VEDWEAFARLVTALRRWLPQLVVAGGWAYRLHRFHARANALGYLPLKTQDADLVFAPDTELAGDVHEALIKADFKEQHFGDDSPPATHYGLSEEEDAFYAEFLTPLHGSGVKRSGKPDATVSNAGITAQKMRYLELLLVSPWSVRVGPERGLPVDAHLDLFVANPTSFIVQKLLIHSDRPSGKRAQDILYIHDTLELFGGSLDELRRLWSEEIRPTMAPRTATRAGTIAAQLFAQVTDTIRNAARIPQDRRLAPEHMQRACLYGLGEILARERVGGFSSGS